MMTKAAISYNYRYKWETLIPKIKAYSKKRTQLCGRKKKEKRKKGKKKKKKQTNFLEQKGSQFSGFQSLFLFFRRLLAFGHKKKKVRFSVV